MSFGISGGKQVYDKIGRYYSQKLDDDFSLAKCTVWVSASLPQYCLMWGHLRSLLRPERKRWSLPPIICHCRLQGKKFFIFCCPEETNLTAISCIGSFFHLFTLSRNCVTLLLIRPLAKMAGIVNKVCWSNNYLQLLWAVIWTVPRYWDISSKSFSLCFF